jgi:hypothetical protein
MSYFGKKSLSWWDYHNHTDENAIRFLHTNPDLQLQILKKWYPIGTRVHAYTFQNITMRVNYKISDHTLLMCGMYQVEISRIDFKNFISLELAHKTVNPVKLIIDKTFEQEIIREHKLSRILKNLD